MYVLEGGKTFRGENIENSGRDLLSHVVHQVETCCLHFVQHKVKGGHIVEIWDWVDLYTG